MRINLKCLLLFVSLVACSLAMQAQDADLKKRINDAVMKVYNEELDANPNDYLTLNGRANQYFVNGDFLRALDDVNRALELTPVKDSETRFEEYMLRAKIYDARGNQEERLADLFAANKLDPSNINCLGLLAQANYGLAHYDDAEACFQRIIRMQPNNYEALAGLGRIEVKRNNYGKAAEYVDRAVKLYTAEPAVYINRAEVLMMMEQYEPAAQDLISALSVGKDTSEAIELLTAMSDVQYDAVMAALNNSIQKAPKNGLFYYIAEKIAMDHNHFADAEQYLNIINKNKLYEYHGLYADVAECQYRLAKYDDALTNVNIAIRAADDVVDYYVLRAKIQHALGKDTEALSSVKYAVALNSDNISALKEQALINIATGKNREALTALNMAIINNSEAAECIALRGWLNKYRLNKASDARQDFAKLLLLDDKLESLRGFALHELGRDDEAIAWAGKKIEEGIMPGGQAYYVAAALMAQCGQTDKAYSYLASALANGFGNKHALTNEDHPVLNVASLKGEKLNAMLSQYASMFTAKKLTEMDAKKPASK